MEREEFSALVGAVQEIAAAVKRIEDRLEPMDGRLVRMEAQFTKIGRRLDHHALMLMDHDRRITEMEDVQAEP